MSTQSDQKWDDFTVFWQKKISFLKNDNFQASPQGYVVKKYWKKKQIFPWKINFKWYFWQKWITTNSWFQVISRTKFLICGRWASFGRWQNMYNTSHLWALIANRVYQNMVQRPQMRGIVHILSSSKWDSPPTNEEWMCPVQKNHWFRSNFVLGFFLLLLLFRLALWTISMDLKILWNEVFSPRLG